LIKILDWLRFAHNHYEVTASNCQEHHESGSVTALSGCKDKEEDAPEPLENAERYQSTRFSKEELPPMDDMRKFMTDVEDQATSNSCTANAVVGGFEYFLACTGQKFDVSRLFVYYNARVEDIKSSLEDEKVNKAKSLDDSEATEATENDEEIENDFESLEGSEAIEALIEDEGSSNECALYALLVYGVCREETWDYKVRIFLFRNRQVRGTQRY
jgi:hypothetical protein